MVDRSKLPAHAKYGPSSMDRIMACPGSVRLQEQAPPQASSPYAAEGTRAHNVAEAMLLQEPGDIEHALNMCSEAGDSIDEVKKAVQVYVDHCDHFLDGAKSYGIEAKLVMDPTLFGTADCYFLTDGVLQVVDYKHGQGVIVSPIENKQMLTYAALLLVDEQSGIEAKDVSSVVLTVIQPRGQGVPVASWICTTEDIYQHLGEMIRAVEIAEQVDAPVKLGTHCKFCTAKLNCPALQAAERGVAKWDSRDLDPDSLDEMLVAAKALEGKIKDLFTYAYDRLEAGEKITGWKLTAGRKSRVWADEAAFIRWAKKNGRMNKVHSHKLLSPAQVDKALGEEYQKVSRFVETREAKPSLKPESAPGEPVENPMAALAALGQRLGL